MASMNQIYQSTSTFHVDPTTPSETMGYTRAVPDQSSTAGLLSSQKLEVHRRKVGRTTHWKLRRLLSDLWFWEAVACMFVLAISAAIGQQLKSLDGQYTATRTRSWSPTSALALAVTIAKAAMLMPVASAISQLKWHSFKEKQELDNMDTFDGASRGVLGSLRLLWRWKCRHFACIGAAILVCALSLDALTQNAVRIVDEPLSTFNDNGVYRTRQYTTVSVYPSRGRNFPPSTMLPSLYYALSSEAVPNFHQGLAVCPSTNCTFGRYDSLAVDYQCVPSNSQRSGQIIFHGGVDKQANAHSLNLTQDIVISSTTSSLPDSGTYKNLGPLISRWLVLANPKTSSPAPQAIECAFYWTVKTYSSNMTNGIFFENTVATYTNTTAANTSGTSDIYITPNKCWRDNKLISDTTTNCTNRVVYQSHQSLKNWFSLTDNSLTGKARNDTQSTDNQTFWSYDSIFMQTMLHRVVNQNETAIMSGVNATAAALASAMTYMLRLTPEVYSDKGNTYGVSYGITIWPSRNVYVIHWGYLIFPAAIVALSTLFFFGTVFATWSDGIWKSSQLALIFHGLSESDSRALGYMGDHAPTMEDMGRETWVQLVETELGKKLQVVWGQGPGDVKGR